MKKIRGVNLGGWLVLEKWIAPELFKDSDALDEYNLLLQLGDSKYEILETHRENFIKEEDFKWMSEYGLNVVRLPIGYWLFEDVYPYVSARKYVDLAFQWADKYGIKVLLDVHAAPGCQNGFDNGGLSGIIDWPKGDNVQKTLNFIDRLTNTYQHKKSLVGIQVLNEPHGTIDLDIIKDFYTKSYDIIRKYLNEEYVIVFHDSFRLNVWKDYFKKSGFKNIILDTHMYQVFSKNDSLRNPVEAIEKASILRYKELMVIDYIDVVVGEWSLGIHKNTLQQLTDDFRKDAFYMAIGNSLLTTFEMTKGWFFWNYKLSEESTKKNIGWSFRDVVSKGYLPNRIKGEKI